jgi:hypothetical protein
MLPHALGVAPRQFNRASLLGALAATLPRL